MLSTHECYPCLQKMQRWRLDVSETANKMGDHIVLDRDVRDWVLVPLTMSIVLMMLIRQYATQVRLLAFAHRDSTNPLWTYLTY